MESPPECPNERPALPAPGSGGVARLVILTAPQPRLSAVAAEPARGAARSLLARLASWGASLGHRLRRPPAGARWWRLALAARQPRLVGVAVENLDAVCVFASEALADGSEIALDFGTYHVTARAGGLERRYTLKLDDPAGAVLDLRPWVERSSR